VERTVERARAGRPGERRRSRGRRPPAPDGTSDDAPRAPADHAHDPSRSAAGHACDAHDDTTAHAGSHEHDALSEQRPVEERELDRGSRGADDHADDRERSSAPERRAREHVSIAHDAIVGRGPRGSGAPDG
jgi:hypothetical protein